MNSVVLNQITKNGNPLAVIYGLTGKEIDEMIEDKIEILDKFLAANGHEVILAPMNEWRTTEYSKQILTEIATANNSRKELEKCVSFAHPRISITFLPKLFWILLWSISRSKVCHHFKSQVQF